MIAHITSDQQFQIIVGMLTAAAVILWWAFRRHIKRVDRLEEEVIKNNNLLTALVVALTGTLPDDRGYIDPDVIRKLRQRNRTGL